MGSKKRILDVPLRHESDFAPARNSRENLQFSPLPLGQDDTRHCPPLNASSDSEPGELLGEPLTIREVARLFGCSEWTIRQQYIPRGLPCFRLSPAGKLVFFHNQIIRWVLEKQRQKGGIYK